MKIVKLIVGLGNPYKKFYHTRHNIGMWFVQILANYFQVTLKEKKKFSGKVSNIIIDNQKIYLFQPEIFMNLSGSLVLNIASYYKINLSEILIIRDELDLIPGVLKIIYSSKHNGHNGIRSIISCFKEKSVFMQLCIGIGRPKLKRKIVEFVLNSPNSIEKKLIQQIITNFIYQNTNFLKNISLFFGKKFYL
nr:aminoacyl-tRNA hydrolase [Buchnera aphidicola]